MAAVFRFTFIQNTKGKGFIFATFIFPILLCAVLILASVFMASGEDSSEAEKSIEKIYISNHTGLSYMDFSQFENFAGEEYGKIKFLTEGTAPENELHSLDVQIEENEQEYAVKIHVPEWSEISYEEAEAFNHILADYVEQLKTIDAVMHSKDNQANERDILTALMPVNVEHTTIGDESAGLGAELIKILLPMFIILVLYMMILLYGQSIGKIIISEKVSKLMETLLITVKPYQLIAGKILAIVAIAVLQIILWVLGLIAGLGIGDLVAKNINPDYSNVIFEAIDLLKELGEGMAFSVPAILLSVAALICGFIFYCVLAGLFAAPVSKAEELASSTGLFQTLVVIAYLVSFILPMQGIESGIIKILLYVIPLTSSFMLAGDILIGNVNVLSGAGYLALLIVFTAGIAIYAGKMYRNQVFYNNASNRLIQKLLK